MKFSDFSIGYRINGMTVVLLLLIVSISSIGVWKMDKLGTEITEIAEVDIPLTKVVTDITLHQLEQAILLEKTAGYLLNSDPEKIGPKFLDLSHKVEKEIILAEEMLADAIKVAHTAEARAEFEKLLATMKQVEVEHATYEKHAKEVFDLLAAGNEGAARAVFEGTEKEQEKLDHELIDALKALEAFTEKAAKQAEADEKLGIRMLLIASIAGLVVGLIASVLISRSIIKPVSEITSVMGRLKDGQTDIEIRFADDKDEVGQMARSVEIFRQNAIEAERMKTAQEELDRKAEQERKKLLSDVAGQIEGSVGAVSKKIGSASDNLKASAQSLSTNASETSSQSTTVASASEEAAVNVQTVASATEELSASVSEIRRQVEHSTKIANDAVQHVASTNEKVQGLTEAATQIGEVVALISDIAEQTNLLALNATIEAARAGEAGKGFAVVASEVKNLANQTGKATGDISSQVAEIQAATDGAVNAILEIGKVIEEINSVSNDIAAAVEEQGSATQEIARNVEQASAGTQEVSSNIATVAAGAQNTGELASNLLNASEDLGASSAELGTHVTKLVAQIRAA